MINEIKDIRKLMSKDEALIQLAEEASELAFVSLELNKKIVFADWLSDVINNDFLEEVADVKLCIDIVDDYNINIYEIFISDLELFECLAMSCCSLAKSAIKLRRSITNSSPTPISYNEAEENLIKSISDVKSCIYAIGNYWDCSNVNEIYKSKAIRCINRFNIIK